MAGSRMITTPVHGAAVAINLSLAELCILRTALDRVTDGPSPLLVNGSVQAVVQLEGKILDAAQDAAGHMIKVTCGRCTRESGQQIKHDSVDEVRECYAGELSQFQHMLDWAADQDALAERAMELRMERLYEDRGYEW